MLLPPFDDYILILFDYRLYFLPIYPNEVNGCRFIFAVQGICPRFFSSFNSNQLPIFDNQIKNAFFASLLDVDVYRLMLIFEEMEDESKVSIANIIFCQSECSNVRKKLWLKTYFARGKKSCLVKVQLECRPVI